MRNARLDTETNPNERAFSLPGPRLRQNLNGLRSHSDAATAQGRVLGWQPNFEENVRLRVRHQRLFNWTLERKLLKQQRKMKIKNPLHEYHP